MIEIRMTWGHTSSFSKLFSRAANFIRRRHVSIFETATFILKTASLMPKTSKKTLIFILGDQLSHSLSPLKASTKDDSIVLMAEVADETTYVPHHKKKIAFILAAMRTFADELRDSGWQVDYVKLDNEDNTGSFISELTRALKRYDIGKILITEPSEYRVMEMAKSWEKDLGCPVSILDDTRFICSHEEFNDWANGRKQLRMEYFYREMRRKTGLLMNGNDPEGDKWNFDSENRKPAENDLFMPSPYKAKHNQHVKDVLELVEDRFKDSFGDLQPFPYAVDGTGAEKALEHFINDALPNFGDYQDAMLTGQPFLYHSMISQYINVGLLDPLKVCHAVEIAYQSGDVPLNAAEGYIRQIIGWREYVRRIYWREMPGYLEQNFLGADRPLPDFYWTAETDMHCISETVKNTRENAYAHHIQRLMVTGNFALLIGVHPKEIHEWYLAVYADAFEWVELPNTLGMSQFVDGGLLASKPYASSGNYINKMSDYCGSCRYKVSQKTGEDACPFNALYWHFMDRNREKLETNPRIGMAYRTWDRMSEDKREEYLDTAENYLAHIG